MKIYVWNSFTCTCQNKKYVESINSGSVITCNKTIEGTKTVPIKTIPTKTIRTKTVVSTNTVPTTFKEKNTNCKI